jgi:osmoprotectant transport system ATP-binding protein
LIAFDHVTKIYPGGVKAVDDLSLEVEGGETLVLLGTSGSGKTTAMKMVNRLVEISSGRISIDGRDVTEQDAISLRRRIGYAIQHIGLFPHMTVGGNIAVVPRLMEWDGDRIAERTDGLLTMVGLEPGDFRDRYPSQLSGGQMQRVGVARALAADPPIVLMDEPFGALDPITRGQLQNEFLELQAEMKKTIIFVTHDVFEAVKMGDRIAVLDAGSLQQLSTPADLVERPANEFVDSFLGTQRFQLSLLTRTVEEVAKHVAGSPVSEPSGHERPNGTARSTDSGRGASRSAERPYAEPLVPERLSVRNSLVEALDLFKRSGRDVLPVYDRDRFTGQLTKKRLIDEIALALGGAEGGGG